MNYNSKNTRARKVNETIGVVSKREKILNCQHSEVNCKLFECVFDDRLVLPMMDSFWVGQNS